MLLLPEARGGRGGGNVSRHLLHRMPRDFALLAVGPKLHHLPQPGSAPALWICPHNEAAHLVIGWEFTGNQPPGTSALFDNSKGHPVKNWEKDLSLQERDLQIARFGPSVLNRSQRP